jgi:hypothetical protein
MAPSWWPFPLGASTPPLWRSSAASAKEVATYGASPFAGRPSCIAPFEHSKCCYLFEPFSSPQEVDDKTFIKHHMVLGGPRTQGISPSREIALVLGPAPT